MSDPYNLKDKKITNQVVLKAFSKTTRKLFIPKGFKSFADNDEPLPISEGQTISQPSLVAYMTQLLDVNRNHTVLEIGTGSGFQTAILSHLAKHITTVEIISSLFHKAKILLLKLGYTNITCLLADDHQHKSQKFDRIMVTAAAKDIPNKLIEQLKSPGKMVIPIGKEHQIQILMLIEKDRSGNVNETSSIPVRFVPLKS